MNIFAGTKISFYLGGVYITGEVNSSWSEISRRYEISCLCLQNTNYKFR